MNTINKKIIIKYVHTYRYSKTKRQINNSENTSPVSVRDSNKAEHRNDESRTKTKCINALMSIEKEENQKHQTKQMKLNRMKMAIR